MKLRRIRQSHFIADLAYMSVRRWRDDRFDKRVKEGF
jgi:hypothetical protein